MRFGLHVFIFRKVRLLVTRKLIALLLVLCLLGNMVVFAQTDENEAFMYLVNESNEHLSLGIFATDIVQDKEANTITFKVRGGEDTSTYLIDEDTVINQPSADAIEAGMATLDWFLDGRASGIYIVIEEADYYKFTRKQNETVHVSGVGGFFVRSVGVGGSSLERDEEEQFYDFFIIFEIMKATMGQGFDRVDITRGEMAQVLINLLHLRGVDVSIPADQEFADVPSGHWAYNAVHLAKQAGHVSGYPGGAFGVDEQITYEQAVKMLVSILGYAPMAEEKGGYPMGYLQVAEEIGMTAGVDFAATDTATRETVARMIMNLVYLPVMEQTGYGSEPRYEIMDGTNDTEVLTFYEKYFR